MMLPEIVGNILLNICIWILLIYTIIVIVWEVCKRIINKFKGVDDDSSSSNSNKRQR
jgi:hypothetical protein